MTWATGWSVGEIVTAAEYKKSMGNVFDSTVTGSVAASVNITGLPTTYANLVVEVYARGDTAAPTANFRLRMNGDSGGNYDSLYSEVRESATTFSVEVIGGTSMNLGAFPANSAPANSFGAAVIRIPNYGNTANHKSATGHNVSRVATGTPAVWIDLTGGLWRSTAAINQLTLTPSAGNFAIGTRVMVYVEGA